MTTLLIVALGVVFWCLAPIPVAIAVGRAFRAAEVDAEFEAIVRDYDLVEA